MTKEYFPHDYGARLSLRSIRKDFGLQGLGFYWCFVEILHEEGGYIKESDLDSIAYDLQVTPELCYAITHNYDLFTVKKGKIFSGRVLRNIKKREEISEARKKAANERWGARRAQETESQSKSEVQEQSEDEEDFSEGVNFYIEQVKTRCDKWHEEIKSKGTGGSFFFTSPAIIVKQRLTNLFDLIKTKQQQKINGQPIDTLEIMKTIVYFFTSEEKRMCLYNLIIEVDEKAASGEIKNKQNYLVSTLFNTAKMNGA